MGEHAKKEFLWDRDRLGWLALCWFEKFGPGTLRKLRRMFGANGQGAFAISREQLAQLRLHDKTIVDFAEWREVVDPAMLARRCGAEEIRFVMDGEPEYPPLLAQIPDAPVALFMRGKPMPTNRTAAIVGTRSMTSYGRTVTRQLARELAEAGLTIVSGLALGIDAEAHHAALDVGGSTIAVLAGGSNDDAIYPRTNLRLAKELITRGTIITEYAPGTECLKHLFPMRNRIIAGLSEAVIVVEAAEKSGSLITAHLAIDYNRDVFSVPGPITHPQSAGTNRLLQRGAIPCLDHFAILERYNLETQTISSPTIQLQPDELRVLELLEEPLHSDDIIRTLKQSSAQVSAWLTSLELGGLIEPCGGHVYQRTRFGAQIHLQTTPLPSSD